MRLRFRSDDLIGIVPVGPDQRCKVQVPSPSGPVWRTFTVCALDPTTGTCELDVVLHDGPASRWAASAEVGDAVQMAGPVARFQYAPQATHVLLAGDAAALPALRMLVEQVPPGFHAEVHVEASLAARAHYEPSSTAAPWQWLVPEVRPGAALVAAVRAWKPPADAQLQAWAAGESAAIRQIRRHLVQELAVPRTHCYALGYWSLGRNEDEAFADPMEHHRDD